MVNKKTTKKKIVKKKTGTRLKLSKGKGTNSTRDKPSSDRASPESSVADPMASSLPGSLNAPVLQSNSHPPQAARRTKKSIEIKEKLELNQVTTCLEDLLRGLKAGTLCIQHGNEYVTLKPSSTIEVEIEASVKKGKERLVLELTWRTERIGEETEFCILSSQPAMNDFESV